MTHPDDGGPPRDSEYSSDRLAGIELDDETLAPANRDIDHERQVAVYDLLQDNFFAVAEHDDGPYHLHLAMRENRLIFDVRGNDQAPCRVILLSLTPFRKVVKAYFALLESYHQAIRTAPPSRIETIDMGRRGLHNEGSEILMRRLDGKIDIDMNTARRLFTLMCALHWKG